MTRPFVPSHAPQGTLAHAIVQAHLVPWLDHRQEQGRPIPKYVEDAFRKYLKCGDPDSGFTTLTCPTGHYSRLVPGRCKGRSFCAYCLTLRQRELGSHLIERVIGNVPVRHLVLCFPPLLRFILGYDPRLLRGGFASLAGAMFEYQRRRTEELFQVSRDRIHPGCVAVNHRVSANLDPNHHIHGLFPDGVFVELEGRLEFRRLPAPTEDEVAGIALAACLAFCKVLAALGFWETTSTSSDTVEGILKLPKQAPRPGKFFGQAAKDGKGGIAPRDGAYAFHLFVSNSIEPDNRPQLQQLVDYVLAPPFTDDQLSLDAVGNILLRLKRERHDGTASTVFTPNRFLDRLADLVPRRNTNSLRYFGIYAPRSRLRSRAIALHLEGSRPDKPSRAGKMVCPICASELRVIPPVRCHRRIPEAIPPDTPDGDFGRRGHHGTGDLEPRTGGTFG